MARQLNNSSRITKVLAGVGVALAIPALLFLPSLMAWSHYTVLTTVALWSSPLYVLYLLVFSIFAIRHVPWLLIPIAVVVSIAVLALNAPYDSAWAQHVANLTSSYGGLARNILFYAALLLAFCLAGWFVRAREWRTASVASRLVTVGVIVTVIYAVAVYAVAVAIGVGLSNTNWF